MRSGKRCGNSRAAEGQGNTLETAVNNCRDATIKKTGQDTKDTLLEARIVRWLSVETKSTAISIKSNVGDVKRGIESLGTRVQQLQQIFLEGLEKARLDSNQGLLEMCREEKKSEYISTQTLKVADADCLI
jgi:hypothetical protein